MCGSSYPRQTSKSVQSVGSIELKDEGGGQVGQYPFSETGTAGPSSFGKYKGTFKTHAECQAFIDGVTAVIDADRGRRSEAST